MSLILYKFYTKEDSFEGSNQCKIGPATEHKNGATDPRSSTSTDEYEPATPMVPCFDKCRRDASTDAVLGVQQAVPVPGWRLS